MPAGITVFGVDVIIFLLVFVDEKDIEGARRASRYGVRPKTDLGAVNGYRLFVRRLHRLDSAENRKPLPKEYEKENRKTQEDWYRSEDHSVRMRLVVDSKAYE